MNITELRKRFESKFKLEPFSGCWLWTGGIRAGGYGNMYIDYRSPIYQLAPRVAWRLYRGEIPEGLRVLHRCDVQSCVNPDHLFLGTQADNVKDMEAKGRRRSARGEAKGSAKLTAEEVRQIREAIGTLKAIAKKFGLGQSIVGYIRANKIWRHV